MENHTGRDGTPKRTPGGRCSAWSRVLWGQSKVSTACDTAQGWSCPSVAFQEPFLAPASLSAGRTPAFTSPSRTFSWVLSILLIAVVEKNQTKQWKSLAYPCQVHALLIQGLSSICCPWRGREEGCGRMSVSCVLPPAAGSHGRCCGRLRASVPDGAAAPRAVCGWSPGHGACRRTEEGLAALGLGLQPGHNAKDVFLVSFLAG